LSIAQFLVVSLVADRQPLLERKPLLLIGADLGGSRAADRGKVIAVQPGLLSQLLAATARLPLPGRRAAPGHQQS